MDAHAPVSLESPSNPRPHRSRSASIIETEPTAPASWRDDATIRRLTWAFLGLGVAIRLTRFLLRYPLWHDEAFLAASFINRPLSAFLEPLDYLQVASPLFVALELVIVRLLGFSEWTLRLAPTLAGIGTLFVFARLARRLLGPWPALWAVAILAVSYSPIRHANEVKPYAFDLLVAAGLMLMAVESRLRPNPARWLAALAIATPIALFLSLPSVFVAGAVALALLPRLWNGTRAEAAAYLAFGLALTISFLGLVAISTGTPTSEFLREHYLLEYWTDSFPPFARGPMAVASWLIAIHTGNLIAYPIGGELGASLPTFVAILAGLAALVRNRQRFAMILLLGPFAMNLLAAMLERYPYGGEARIAQHLAPSIALLAGLGLARLIDRLSTPARQVLARRAALELLTAIGVLFLLLSIAFPYHLNSSANARAFARWFWPSQASDSTIVCVKADLRRDFEPWQWVTGISAEYLCNQRIYSLQHQAPRSPSEMVPTPDRPLRCVVYQVHAYDPIWEKPAFRDWIAPLRSKYFLTSIETYPVNTRQGLVSWKEETYHVFEFQVRPPDLDPSAPDALDRIISEP